MDQPVIDGLIARITQTFGCHQRLQTALDSNQGSPKRLNEHELQTFCEQTKYVGDDLWDEFSRIRAGRRLCENYSLGDYVRSVLTSTP